MNALFLGLGNTDYLNYFNGLNNKIAVAAADRPELLHYLPSIADQSYEAVFVAAELIEQAGEQSFANWLRIVKKSGSLFLENSDANRSALIRGLSLIEPLVHTVEAMGGHTTAVRKRDGGFPALQYLHAALAAESEGQTAQAHYHHVLARTAAPADFAIAQHAALFYHRQHLSQQSEKLWTQMQCQLAEPRTRFAHILDILIRGDYPRGFKLREAHAAEHWPYERRSHAYPPPSGSLREKRWQGEDLTGKTLAVWSEFGLGDEMMFASLATALKRHFHAARVVWVAQPPIVSLLRSHPDIDEVVSAATAAQDLPPVDYWEFPHTLLAHTDTPFAELPQRNPYLFPDPEKQKNFDTKAFSGCLKIGLAWRGDPKHENDAYRSLHHPEWLDRLLSLPDTAWFNLQKNLNQQEQAWVASRHITDWRDRLHDFADTAAALSQLDLLVCADTSVVHAAGALGVPALVLLPTVYDWRWGLPHNGISTWYPNVFKIFPPTPLDGWQGMIEAARAEIVHRMQAA